MLREPTLIPLAGCVRYHGGRRPSRCELALAGGVCKDRRQLRGWTNAKALGEEVVPGHARAAWHLLPGGPDCVTLSHLELSRLPGVSGSAALFTRRRPLVR